MADVAARAAASIDVVKGSVTALAFEVRELNEALVAYYQGWRASV